MVTESSKNTQNTNNNGSVKATGNSTNSAVSNAPQTGETNGIYRWLSIFGMALALSFSF